jgi:hypothetical protein
MCSPLTARQMRVRLARGVPEAARALELSLGSTLEGSPGAAPRVRWSEGAMLYTLAPGLLTTPGTAQDAQLPMVRRSLPTALHASLPRC